MKFGYKARTKEGELQVGNVEATSRETAVSILSSHGLFILSVTPMEKSGWTERFTEFFRRVRTTDLMIFTRQFATLLSSQVPIGDSLRNLYHQTTRPILKEVVGEVVNDVEAGFSLSQAFGRHPGVFSEFYVNMVKSAEVTGRLSETLDFLADYLEKQSALMSKMKNAMTYPIFILALFIVAVLVMVTMVLPQITPIFAESKVELPLMTKILIVGGNFILVWWWAVLIALGFMIVLVVDYFRTEEGKIVLNEITLRTPILGGVLKQLYVSRFADAVRVLINGGLTIPQSVEVTSHIIGNYVYRDILHNAAQKIRQGQLLSQALKDSPYFPPLVTQLISIGESTGRLESLLQKIGDFYRRQVEDKVNNMVELIQPILMVIVGLMVAGLFASILLPLYNLTSSF